MILTTIDKKILRYVMTTEGPVTRTMIIDEISKEYVKTHVGYHFTDLKRKGLLLKVGKGYLANIASEEVM